MPLECRWIDNEDGWGEVGDCFFSDYPSSILSTHYKDFVADTRQPVIVVLPDRQGGGRKVRFCIDSHPSADPHEAWGVEVDMASLVPGQKPRITVTPSIDCKGSYHGFLQDGVLTDDLG